MLLTRSSLLEAEAVSDYQEHEKCRGCGADIWGLDVKPTRGYHVVHNEANCLSYKLDKSRADLLECFRRYEGACVCRFDENDDNINTCGHHKELQSRLGVCRDEVLNQDATISELRSRLHSCLETLTYIWKMDIGPGNIAAIKMQNAAGTTLTPAVEGQEKYEALNDE